MKNKIDLKKVKNIYEIAGSWVWKYNRCQTQYTWNRIKYKNPVLENKNTGEIIKGLKNIIKYCEINNLELEIW